jgi:predicted dienelactone hydrolase
MEALASYGFVVVSPEHIGNSQNAPGNSFEVAGDNRLADVTFIIDFMTGSDSDLIIPFHGLLDPDLVGVTGHSMGGFTAMAAVAGWNGAAGDYRVAAIAPISGTFEDSFTPEQIEAIEIPVLLLGGTLDTSVPISNNDYAFAHLAPPAYQINIIDAKHTHFANICEIGDMLIDFGFETEHWPAMGAEELLIPYKETCTGDAIPVIQVQRLQNLYVTAFFNFHLCSEQEFEIYLTPEYSETSESGVEFLAK